MDIIEPSLEQQQNFIFPQDFKHNVAAKQAFENLKIKLGYHTTFCMLCGFMRVIIR